MAYDRYDTRDDPREERSRWSNDDRYSKGDRDWRGDNRADRDRGDRGFFERAGDEIASWFGDDDAERRRRRDQMNEDRHDRGPGARQSETNRSYNPGYDGEHDRDRDRSPNAPRRRDWNDNRGAFARGGSSEGDYDRNWRQEYAGRGFEQGRADRELDRGWNDRYQPVTGDYGRGSGDSRDRANMGGRGEGNDRSQSEWAQDPYRSTSRAGSANWSDRSREERSARSREGGHDPHYKSWRDRHMGELDRDYDDYRAENQSRFENDFGGWRERRQQKRGLLGLISEKMEVIGSDKKHVGTVDKVMGDRVILTKSDQESGGVHHSLSCSDIERVEGDKVILDCSGDEARKRWRDESRSRALFERDDQGEAGPRMLDRSFEGTYRKNQPT